MEYGKVLERAWNATWRHKILWLFGFLASLPSRPGNSAQGGIQYRFDDWSMQVPEWAQWSIAGLALLFVILLLLTVAVLSTIGRGALIDGVRQAEEKDKVSGREAWQAGVSRFWSLLSIGFLHFLAMALLILPVILGVIAGVAVVAAANARPGVVVAIVGGACLLAMPLFAVGVALGLLREFADRACVLEELSTGEAIKRGWKILKANVGPILIIGVILFIINVILSGVFFGGAVTIGAPTVNWLPRASRNPGVLAGLCCLGMIALVIAFAVGTLLQTFSSALWTLTYRELTVEEAEGEEPVELEFLDEPAEE